MWVFCYTLKHFTIIGSNERIFGNIPEHILHRSHNRDQIVTFIKDSKSRASCECFTLILHIYSPIRLDHVLREDNEHLITSNGRRFFFFFNSTINKFCHKNKRVFFSRYQYTANAPVLSDIDGSGPREKAYIL